jgi:transposase InsO family protein
VGLWLKGIRNHGLEKFLTAYEGSKRGPRKKKKVDAILKRRVWEIREREQRTRQGCCGQKIAYYLEQEYGTQLSVARIYQILGEKYVLRSKRRYKTYGPVPEATAPRQVVQMDTIDFGGLYAFTAVDIWSREVDLVLRPTLTSADGAIFLKQTMERRFDGRVELLQTDGGPEFKDKFSAIVLDYCAKHRIARAYKKNEQSYIESFNRTVRTECLGWTKYAKGDLDRLTVKVDAFLKCYHYHRPHLALSPLRPPLKAVVVVVDNL